MLTIAALLSLNTYAYNQIVFTVKTVEAQEEPKVEVPHSQKYQWAGYIAQLGSSVAIHAIGYEIIKKYDNFPWFLLFLMQISASKAMQHHISNDIFEFNKTDWASSENNWANFWGWFIARIS